MIMAILAISLQRNNLHSLTEKTGTVAVGVYKNFLLFLNKKTGFSSLVAAIAFTSIGGGVDPPPHHLFEKV